MPWLKSLIWLLFIYGGICATLPMYAQTPYISLPSPHPIVKEAKQNKRAENLSDAITFILDTTQYGKYPMPNIGNLRSHYNALAGLRKEDSLVFTEKKLVYDSKSIIKGSYKLIYAHYYNGYKVEDAGLSIAYINDKPVKIKNYLQRDVNVCTPPLITEQYALQSAMRYIAIEYYDRYIKEHPRADNVKILQEKYDQLMSGDTSYAPMFDTTELRIRFSYLATDKQESERWRIAEGRRLCYVFYLYIPLRNRTYDGPVAIHIDATTGTFFDFTLLWYEAYCDAMVDNDKFIRTDIQGGGNCGTFGTATTNNFNIDLNFYSGNINTGSHLPLTFTGNVTLNIACAQPLLPAFDVNQLKIDNATPNIIGNTATVNKTVNAQGFVSFSCRYEANPGDTPIPLRFTAIAQGSDGTSFTSAVYPASEDENIKYICPIDFNRDCTASPCQPTSPAPCSIACSNFSGNATIAARDRYEANCVNIPVETCSDISSNQVVRTKTTDSSNPMNVRTIMTAITTTMGAPTDEQAVKWCQAEDCLTPIQQTAVSTHFNIKRTDNFFKTLFSATQADYLAATNTIKAQTANINDNNAQYTPNGDYLVFGNGNGSHQPLVSLGVVSHEFTHMVLDKYIGKPFIDGETGALHEGLADIMSVLCRINEGADPNDPMTWTFGAEIARFHDIHPNLPRYLHSPNQSNRRQADTYNGTVWTADNILIAAYPLEVQVKKRLKFYLEAGVVAKWFYLLVNGGHFENDAAPEGILFKVDPIGLSNAQTLLANTLVLFEEDEDEDVKLDYITFAEKSLEAARDLSGGADGQCDLNSIYRSVWQAWAAVNITKPSACPNIPNADFDVSCESIASGGYGITVSIDAPDAATFYPARGYLIYRQPNGVVFVYNSPVWAWQCFDRLSMEATVDLSQAQAEYYFEGADGTSLRGHIFKNSDGCGSNKTEDNVNYLGAPIFGGIHPTQISTCEGEQVCFGYLAADLHQPININVSSNSAGFELTHSVINNNDVYSTEGQYCFTPTAAQVGTHTITISATDSHDTPYTSEQTYTIEVQCCPEANDWQVSTNPAYAPCPNYIQENGSATLLLHNECTDKLVYTVNNQISHTIYDLPPGDHTLTVAYNNETHQIPFHINTSSPIIPIPSVLQNKQHTSVVCGADQCTGSINLSASGGSGEYYYFWSDMTYPTDTYGDYTTSIFAVSTRSNLCAGIYTVTVQDATSGCETILNIDIGAGNVISNIPNINEPTIEALPTLFDNTTKIEYTLPEDAIVTLTVYNVLGIPVKTLLNSTLKEAGIHEIIEEGGEYSNGLYYFTLEVCNSTKTKTTIKY
jgi:Zn-dependent metalloprotease